MWHISVFRSLGSSGNLSIAFLATDNVMCFPSSNSFFFLGTQELHFPAFSMTRSVCVASSGQWTVKVLSIIISLKYRITGCHTFQVAMLKKVSIYAWTSSICKKCYMKLLKFWGYLLAQIAYVILIIIYYKLQQSYQIPMSVFDVSYIRNILY